MKKNTVLDFTKVLYILFIIGTIIILFIMYSYIHSSIAFKFLIGYLFLTIFLILYVTLITILNSRKLKCGEERKGLIKFITLFILYGTLNYIFDYIFRHSNIDLFKDFSIALGLAFATSFIDGTLEKKDN